jgi:putative acetyltransferase
VSGVQVSIRPYRDTDAQPTLDIFYRAVHQTAARDYTDEQIGAWAAPQSSTWEWESRRAAANTWVAEVHGVLVGFTDLDATGYIDMMYVDPDHTRQGIAARLLEHLVGIAAAAHLEVLSVQASITARPFFVRHGFTVVAEQSPQRHGVHLTNYRMQRPLIPAESRPS